MEKELNLEGVGLVPKMLAGPAVYELVDRVASERLGTGEIEIEMLEEGDLGLGPWGWVLCRSEDNEKFARGRMPWGAELWRESRYIFAA